MTQLTPDTPTFRALLVGCDRYFPNRLPNGGSYASLHGCVRDVARIESMLRARIAAPVEITRLTASHGHDQPAEPPAEWPTAANLRTAFADLVARARPGDQVYIHYSGHGGRALTAHADLKGAGAVDEALVPIDIGDGPSIVPGNYLRDVELAGFVTRIAARIGAGTPGGGALSLTFDSCHSGGTLRGVSASVSASVLRCATGGTGIDATLDTTPPVASEQAATSEDRRTWSDLRRDAAALRAASGGGLWLPPSRSYVLLAACDDTQSAIETIGDDQQPGGVLTGAFLDALGALAGKPSWLTVYHRTLARVRTRFAAQTPLLLGDPMREIFGAELRPIEPVAPVLEVNATQRRVRIGAGLATLVDRGVEFGIFSPDTRDFSANDALIATACVTRAQAAECWADLDSTSDPDRIALGAPAVVLNTTLRRRVAVFRRCDMGPTASACQDAALAAISSALATSGRGFVTEASGSTPDYQVAVNERGEYELWDPRGEVIPHVTPALRADPANAAQVVERLLRLARYSTVLGLTSPPSDLGRSVDVALFVGPPGWTDRDPLPTEQQLSPLTSSSDGGVVADLQVVFLRVNNQGAKRVHVAAIDLTCDWSIDLIVPNPKTGTDSETVGAGEARLFPITMYLPAGFTATRDVIKVFVTTDAAPFASLTQPALDQAAATRTVTRAADTALARVFGALDADTNTTRAARPAMSHDLEWTVSVFYLQVADGEAIRSL